MLSEKYHSVWELILLMITSIWISSAAAASDDCDSYDFYGDKIIEIREELAKVIEEKATINTELLAKLESKALGCDWDIAYKLGNLYYNGQGIEQDTGKAAFWYRESSLHGYTEALYMLGVIHLNDSMYLDYKTAREIFELLAKKNHAKAQYGLGYMYLKGEGVPKNIELAKSFLTKSGNNGYKAAYSGLGIIDFKSGLMDSAKQNFLVSASSGDALAIYYLGLISERQGNDIDSDKYYKSSCDAGFHKACLKSH